MSLTPTEKNFEAHIEGCFLSAGYTSTNFREYDPKRCLIKDQLIDFIKKTQPEQWDDLYGIHGVDTEERILSSISSEISKRGIIDVLRNQLAYPGIGRSIYLNLCYFEPKSKMNAEHAKLFELNHFTVVRQLYYSNQNKNSIDIVLFLNGLPILSMELKNQLTNQDIKDSEKQYRNDRDPKEPLLQFKRCLAHFCVDDNSVSMTTRLSGSKTVFLPYNRDLENPPVEYGYRTNYLWEEVLSPSSILDILENFVHVSKEKEVFFNEKTQKIDSKNKEILIFPRYHQLDLIRNFRRQLKEDGVGKHYLVQHTTGSGKSYSIGWLAHTLNSFYRPAHNTKPMFDAIVVVTDRRVLDDQLQNTIISLQQTPGVVNPVREGSQQLKAFLEQGKDIVITTIQKFPFIVETIGSLGDRTFGVIIDEVHSSQSGEWSKELNKSLSKTDDEVFDYADRLRQEIQSRGRQDHISFFGFTATPKEKTLELFGTKTPEGEFVPFHIYSMYQSIHEGFTLDVLQNYTTYKRYFKIKQTKDSDIKVPTDKGKRELIRYVDAHEMTIKKKVNIMLDHWINKGSKEIQSKARGMVVTQSRKHCIWYFKEINRQLEERGIDYRCLVGFSGEVALNSEEDDNEKYTESGLNLTIGHKGDVPLGLKDPNYRLLVVANKFQTGFDEPLMQSMYVDKKLSGVQCVQTLSRLNRTTSGKTQTFVLDFVNTADDIQEAFQPFYQSTILSTMLSKKLEDETDLNGLYETKKQIYDFYLYTHEDVNRFCKAFYDSERDEGLLHPILDKAVDQFKKIEDEKQRKNFKAKVQSYIQIYGYLSQIISLTDIELEKTFIFLKYLSKKLPKRDKASLDISNAIDLDSLRIQKMHERQQISMPECKPALSKHIAEHIAEHIVEPIEKPTQKTLKIKETPASYGQNIDLLAEIIKQVNQEHGVHLTHEDEAKAFDMKKQLHQDTALKKYMHADNTEDNKRHSFKKKFEEIIIDCINENFRFYKKMDENPSIKYRICDAIYVDYPKNKYQELEDGLYTKSAKLAIQEGLASEQESRDLLDDIC